MGALGIVFSAT